MEIVIIILAVTSLISLINLFRYRNKHHKNVQFYLERQFNEVLNSMHQAILLFDHDNKMVFYNRYAEVIFQLKIKDLGLSASQIFGNNKFNEKFKTGENSKTFDINFNNKIYLVQIYKIQKTFSKNNVSSLVILNNVTEERKIEETKRDFFAHASHELKSPLTAILGYSELVKLKMIDENELDDIIDRIYNQASHMSVLVDDMSTLSRLETLIEKDDMYDTINLNRVLKEVLYTLDPFIKDKNIYIDLYEEDIDYKCIELDIKKLFKNLIENAIKYSFKDSNVQIRLFKDNKYINIIVKDEGIGIAEEHLVRIFERFYRVDKGRLDKGTGLGLAIVKHTVIRYNGKIDLSSKLNEGTTINIKLKA